MSKKTRFTDSELKEFRSLIEEEKIEKAKADLDLLKSSYMNDGNNGTEDTAPTFKAFEEGSETMSKEANTQLALRQEKFIRDLKNALIRIENKTYGICRVTGNLINKKRLFLVPHATLSIEAKKYAEISPRKALNTNKTYFDKSWAAGIIILILLVDQITKIYIKLNFPLSGYGISPILDWEYFKIIFVENKGMAMGTKINDFIPFINENTGKLILTIFRIAAISGLGYWLLDSIRKQSGVLLCWALSLIFAGALGNIIDSIFYGVLFSDSNGQIAQFFPEKGYAPPFFMAMLLTCYNFR